MADEKIKTRAIIGVVVSDKMDKTITIKVERLVKHPIYGKYIKRSTKYAVHDENNQAKEGDTVSITSCKPMSKNKAFSLLKVIETAEK